MQALRLLIFGTCLGLAASASAQAAPPDQPAERKRLIACSDGAATVCTELLAAHRKGCADGVGWRCSYLGLMEQRGLGTKVSWVSALKAFDRGCELGHGAGCAEMADILFELLKRSKDPKLTAKLDLTLERGCKAKAAALCLRLGSLLHVGRHLEKDKPRARQLFMRACVLGSNDGCGRYGSSFTVGLATSTMDRAAIVILESACDAGRARACIYAAIAHARGIAGLAKSPKAAVKRYEKACELGSMWGCYGLARHLDSGRGIARDLERAVALYRRACKGNDAAACSELGSLHEQGRGVPSDLGEAVRLHDKACTMGCPPCCAVLAALLDKGGPGLEKDPARAADLRKRACAGGYQEACPKPGP